MFYEIIYETGRNSVAFYENDEEAIRAISTHHNRAKTGGYANQAAGSELGPAERIVKVLKYERHPVEHLESQAVPASDVTAAVEEAIKKYRVGDLVSVPEIAAAVRDITSATVNSEPHETNYAMQEVGELTGWEGDAA